jgi:hypothetical protein
MLFRETAAVYFEKPINTVYGENAVSGLLVKLNKGM